MIILQSNLAIRNFLVALKLFLNAKSSLSICSKWQIGHRKWFLNTNLLLIKPFLIAKFDCTYLLWCLFKKTLRKNDVQFLLMGKVGSCLVVFPIHFCPRVTKRQLRGKFYVMTKLFFVQPCR